MARKRVTWTKKAQQDRKEILSYWRTRNQTVSYSKKLNDLIKKTVALIATHPHIGRKTDVPDVRIKSVGDYLIFYKECSSRITILRIWDSRQNPEYRPH